MKRLLMASVLVSTVAANAETIRLQSDYRGVSSIEVNTIQTLSGEVHEVNFDLKKVNAESLPGKIHFKTLSEKNISFSQDVGLASVPFKSLVVAGTPDKVEVTVDAGPVVEADILPAPSQEEDCRCATDKTKAFAYSPFQKRSIVRKDYLGTYRGQPLTRVTIYGADNDYSRKTVQFFPKLRAQIVTSETMSELYNRKSKSTYDYLIVTPSALLSGLDAFVVHKTVRGHDVKVVELESIGADVKKLTEFFKSEYKSNQYKYALIVGTDTLVPNHQVNTSGSPRTPSDYPYFLMDSNDMIPDVQYGRVVASTADEVRRQTQKWMDYQDRRQDTSALLHMIGIASNEGSNPSDDEYVKEIENDLNGAYGTTASHFHQDMTTSKPGPINEAFNKGAGYVTYLGHGSGTSWASTGTWYTTADVKKLDNANVQQPVIIDVACMNGVLKKGYFGETWMNSTNSRGDSIGAAMYFGGSVNISWHPPAIMAKGIVKRTISQRLETIGDALLAGQLYLLENYTQVEAVRDNFEWYHLFGEPSSELYFK